MKAYFLYCFFIVNFYQLNAQENFFQVIIYDKDMNLPLENANVMIFKNKENYLSNKEGIVKFGLKGSSFIEISHQDNKSQKLRITPKTPIELKVFLEPKIKQLEEVILTQKHPQEILKSIVKQSSKLLKLPANLKIYSKEFYKYNDEYILFSDGLLNFQIYKNTGTIKSDILIEQCRTIGLKKPLQEDLWGFNLNTISEKYYSFSHLSDLLDKKSRKDYNFNLKSHSTNDAYNILEIKPIDEIDKLLYFYRITFDYRKKIIFEIEISIPNNKSSLFFTKSDNQNRRINKMNIVQKFIEKEKEYYILNTMENIEYLKTKSDQEVKIEVKNIMHTIRYYDYLFTYKNHEMFKKKSLILSEKNKVYTNYWEYDSGIYMNEEEKKILNYLEIFTSKTN